RQLSLFMKQWKQRSSVAIRKVLERDHPRYAALAAADGHIWQPKYYAFNVSSEKKVVEKLNYMHENPVRAGLVERAIDWLWSSARWYDSRRSVGLLRVGGRIGTVRLRATSMMPPLVAARHRQRQGALAVPPCGCTRAESLVDPALATDIIEGA